MKPAVRIGDLQVCNQTSGGVSHVGGLITPNGQRSVFINNTLAATVGDLCTCVVGGPNNIVAGSTTVFFNGKLAARKQIMATRHGGQVSVGSPNVLIGD